MKTTDTTTAATDIRLDALLLAAAVAPDAALTEKFTHGVLRDAVARARRRNILRFTLPALAAAACAAAAIVLPVFFSKDGSGHSSKIASAEFSQRSALAASPLAQTVADDPELAFLLGDPVLAFAFADDPAVADIVLAANTLAASSTIEEVQW
jgi:hypothetical protein